MIYLRLVDLLNHIEHQLANYKLCFLSEEKLFKLIVDLIKTILAAFISRLVRHLCLHLFRVLLDFYDFI